MNTAYSKFYRLFYLLHGKDACAVKSISIIKLLFFAVFAKIAHGKDLCRVFIGNTHDKYLCRTNLCRVRFAVC
jgi:hypothetical protein